MNMYLIYLISIFSTPRFKTSTMCSQILHNQYYCYKIPQQYISYGSKQVIRNKTLKLLPVDILLKYSQSR